MKYLEELNQFNLLLAGSSPSELLALESMNIDEYYAFACAEIKNRKKMKK